ncbi:hypothetical protein ACVWWI_004355 [Bradyrhizobium sp. USDA 3686]|uniref:hypothetical protein n=1 Tax=Bradyrhizobium TaxID=374 RepID=UPI0019566F27|nr:hypothetical protein [Bradyrhizobium canariense]MBM7482334.1 hypothetical protein [Bradyrhizobium canariense]UFW69517.1 hypothetical protein BcanWU425_22475 [Bradyrhizobium canariense]
MPEKSKQCPLCFVIGPIGRDGTSERKHADLLLHSVIRHVLESGEFNYKVKRADEDADPGMIGDRVVSDIINSDLVVADLTDLNPNAFYELGIRHSTEKPTIHMAKLGTALPFDNISHRTIFVDLMDWHSTEAARSRLADAARAIRAADYKVSNPITQANASFRMRRSEDPRDRFLADVQERMFFLENSLTRTSPEELIVSERQEVIRQIKNEVDHLRRRGQSDAFIKTRLETGPFSHRLSGISIEGILMRTVIDGGAFVIGIDPPIDST